ncbi:SEC1 family transport protein SLY1 [Astathelohania contejeani]|uniref:SEC1 family transport protein SLY1 n=1 Tax=Astathelohania contejeani TaxID=164912 RepID=A0ABQ7I2S6_9MICR|nr:SEC1 family transport protein SLY1 [Thelohania contejeani]
MLKKLQKKRILELLKTSSPWKVLILDAHTHSLVSTLLRTNDLRDAGVTTHMLITSTRQHIRNTPAVYFIEPTKENLAIVKSDVAQKLYSGTYLHLCSSIPRKYLENIAYSLSEIGRGYDIRSVQDGFVDFVSLQDSLFSFEIKDSFFMLQQKNEILTNKISENLFSVFATLGESPFVIDRSNVQGLCDRFNARVEDTGLIKTGRKRPLLILLNRELDMLTPFEHVWSYNALIHDILGMKLNRIKWRGEDGEIHDFDMDTEDPFWIANQGAHFPVVAEKAEKELLDYKKEMAVRSFDENADRTVLREALASAPELSRRNEAMHRHMTICLELVRQIRERSLDEFVRSEREKQTNLEGNAEDKLRMEVVRGEGEDPLVEYTRRFGIPTRSESYNHVVSKIIGGVKKLLPVPSGTPASRIVEEVLKDVRNNKHKIYEREISRIVVFCIGGGTYTEYNSLKELEKKIGIEIIYGSTEIINSKDFIENCRKAMNINE